MKQKLNTRLSQNGEKYKAMEQFWEPGWRPVSKPRLIQENSLEKQQKRQNRSAGQPEGLGVETEQFRWLALFLVEEMELLAKD